MLAGKETTAGVNVQDRGSELCILTNQIVARIIHHHRSRLNIAVRLLRRENLLEQRRVFPLSVEESASENVVEAPADGHVLEVEEENELTMDLYKRSLKGNLEGWSTGEEQERQAASHNCVTEASISASSTAKGGSKPLICANSNGVNPSQFLICPQAAAFPRKYQNKILSFTSAAKCKGVLPSQSLASKAVIAKVPPKRKNTATSCIFAA